MQPFLTSLPILGSTLMYLSFSTAQQLSRPFSTSDAVETLAIEQVLNHFAIAVDQRQFDLFPQIFTLDVTVNFNTPGVPVLHGIDAVTSFMSTALQAVDSYHAQSTHYIDLSNLARPHATTYNSAQFFGTGDRKGSVYSNWGRLVA